MKWIFLVVVICIAGFVNAGIDGIIGLDLNSDKVTGNITYYNNYTYNNYTINGSTFDVDQFDEIGDVIYIAESWLTGFIEDWFATQTTDDLTEGSVNKYDNQTWNQALADTLYANINATLTDSNIYKIYFNSSIKNVITYNLTEADADIITVATVGGKKIIYGGDFA